MSAHADKMLTDEIVPRLRLPNDIRWNGLGTTDARGGRQKACGVASGSHSTEFHWDLVCGCGVVPGFRGNTYLSSVFTRRGFARCHR